MIQREQLDLFCFGLNNNGEYVNLVEEEEKKNALTEKEFVKWLENHENPLIRIAEYFFNSYASRKNYTDIKDRLEKAVATKCYHYGNMKKRLYIFSMYCEHYGVNVLVFDNDKHYLALECRDFYFKEPNKELAYYPIEEYLSGNVQIGIAASCCPVFDLNGNQIKQWRDGKEYKQDIRHICCMKEWQMEKYSTNRIRKGKKIEDFYEIQFKLPDLIKYWGEDN